METKKNLLTLFQRNTVFTSPTTLVQKRPKICSKENENTASHKPTIELNQPSTSSMLTEAENLHLKDVVNTLQKKLEAVSFSYEKLLNNDSLISIYTGFTSGEIFEVVFNYLIKAKINYYNGWIVDKISKYVPGCTDVMLDYSEKGIFLRLYYPTSAKQDEDHSNSDWTLWTPDEEYINGIARAIFVKPFILRLLGWWYCGSNLYIPALHGEKVNTDNKLKCVIFSHGYASNRFFYSIICNELASRGYLVAAIEHRDRSACFTYYYDGKENVKKNIKTPMYVRHISVGHYVERNKQVNQRAEEVSKLLDFLINLNNGQVPFNILDDLNKNDKFKLSDLVGRLDMDNMTMVGHSFGGATALLTLSQRKELKQGILLDPWMFPLKDEKSVIHKITQPLLFINTQTFHILANVKAMEQYLSNDDRHMYTILHTTHESQTDSIHVIGHWLNWFMRKLTPDVALNINNALMLRFLKQYTGHKENIDDLEKCLEKEKTNIAYGLTKPWA